ncbi:MAG: hypothetical protein AAF250_08950 [Pseudomonadota bacterium]
MSAAVKALELREIAAVSGAGREGFDAGYKAAKALGANEIQAIAVGVLASAAEDALKGE